MHKQFYFNYFFFYENFEKQTQKVKFNKAIKSQQKNLKKKIMTITAVIEISQESRQKITSSQRAKLTEEHIRQLQIVLD